MKRPATFGEYVTMTRQQRGYSERHVARQVGVANTTISRIVNGSVPHPELFLALVDTLDLDIVLAVTLVEPYRRIVDRVMVAQKGKPGHAPDQGP
ncbi:helix-turn-helix protein [Herbihabitans rhizosphaerae]|uniref:Helix-turn-helix protein n=1 Tax=Herbihabitans rhizosphaerae TaxID=1872711 RepID=A0A4Q7KDS3_9PSEU|nr:helix-turn-helix transcriptional regulator [Herbihabitans rhizosphaerae]RZS30519.1 helix-turn-helix protein [Herbihabitans rhizosphaerae]